VLEAGPMGLGRSVLGAAVTHSTVLKRGAPLTTSFLNANRAVVESSSSVAAGTGFLVGIIIRMVYKV